MPDYAKMYQLLFQAITYACRLMDLDDIEGSLHLLKQAQLLTELVYINSSEGFDYDPDEYTINRIIFDDDGEEVYRKINTESK